MRLYCVLFLHKWKLLNNVCQSGSTSFPVDARAIPKLPAKLSRSRKRFDHEFTVCTGVSSFLSSLLLSTPWMQLLPLFYFAAHSHGPLIPHSRGGVFSAYVVLITYSFRFPRFRAFDHCESARAITRTRNPMKTKALPASAYNDQRNGDQNRRK